MPRPAAMEARNRRWRAFLQRPRTPRPGERFAPGRRVAANQKDRYFDTTAASSRCSFSHQNGARVFAIGAISLSVQAS